MHRSLSKRRIVTATFIMMLLVTTLIASLLPKATATPSPAKIDSIYPTSGPVGTNVTVIGEIDTTNGSYKIYFDEKKVRNGTSVGTAVNTTFTVPLSAKGNHSVTLVDVASGNQSLPVTFNVITSYYVTVKPVIIQEGLNTTITVGVDEAEANATYTFTINVTDSQKTIPNNYTATLIISTNVTGSGSNSTLYYGNFSAGANTNYVGNYTIAVMAINETLTTGSFTVGLTDKLEYRRTEIVNIRGAGYIASETVTVNITTTGVSVTGYPKNVTTDPGGIVAHSWNITIDSTPGTYTITLTNATMGGTVKPVPDVQNFWVERIFIDPKSGRWGTNVTVVGKIVTPNGTYQILWDGNRSVGGGTAQSDGAVNGTFIVPTSVKGDHNITLYDDNQTTKSMPATFEVTTSCYVLAKPARVLEGLSPTITVGVHEAKANANYTFTINITDPLNGTWTKNILVTVDNDGSGKNSTMYPGDFTDYLGIYSITVNTTLANGSFTVGLTNELEYIRTKPVIIQGSGYGEGETVTVNITFAETGESVFSEDRSVIDGIVGYLWTIPENATLGIYTVTLVNTPKPIPDIQNFTVIEIIVYCQARNKYDNKSLAGVTVKAYIGETRIVSGTTNKTGWVDFRVNRANYTFEALWENETVGSLSESVTGDLVEYVLQKTFYIGCELAHIRIAISDEADQPLPFIDVTLTSPRLTEPLSFETNYTGTIATNTFTDTNYTIKALRHGLLFNRTLIENLTVTRWINITCPTYTLFAHVLDSKGLPLQNVEVVVYEWNNGAAKRACASGTTNGSGSATLDCLFGKYKIWVYNQNRKIILNKTVIDLTEDRLFLVIHCKIVNVDLSVVVKDYFGNPIPNALVKVERENVDILPQKTGSNGKTSFENIIGGEVRISVSVKGKLCETRTLHLDETKVIVLKIEKFVVVGGYPLEVTQLITLISLGILITVFALALIYRKLRLRKVSEEKEKSL